jgi:LysM domain
VTSSFYRRLLVGAGCALAFAVSTGARAFPHVVQPGDTLASLSEKFYGKIQNERLLVVANSLDDHGGIRIVPGMRLEIPSVSYLRVTHGQTWKELAMKLLGHEDRSLALSDANGSKPWLLPEEDSEIVVPYNLRVVATGNETILALAYRYLGDRKHAWMLDNYNQRKGRTLVRGEVVLIPLVDVELSEVGKQAAAEANARTAAEGGGRARSAQQAAQTSLPELYAALNQGQYVEVVRLGTALLQSGPLGRKQKAKIQRLLLEAYVALGTTGRATEACAEWLKADPKAKLDAVQMSPKIIAACEPVTQTPSNVNPSPSASGGSAVPPTPKAAPAGSTRAIGSASPVQRKLPSATETSASSAKGTPSP